MSPDLHSEAENPYSICVNVHLLCWSTWVCKLCYSYLVMPYMFTDLSKVRGLLSEDRIQFLVYQMLCGLKVCLNLCCICESGKSLLYSYSVHKMLIRLMCNKLCTSPCLSFTQYIHGAGIIHRVSEAGKILKHLATTKFIYLFKCDLKWHVFCKDN